MAGSRYFLIIASIVVVGVVGVGLGLVSGPNSARQEAFDRERARQIADIAYAIDQYWQREEKLPDDLAFLEHEDNTLYPVVEPDTGRAYQYTVLGDRQFELCATFLTDAKATGQRPVTGPLDRQKIWLHPAGDQCFALQVNENW